MKFHCQSHLCVFLFRVTYAVLDFSKNEVEFSMFIFSCSDVLVRDTLYANTEKFTIFRFALVVPSFLFMSPVNDKLVDKNAVCIS